MKQVILLGEAMGENELKIGRGFVGASGIELLRMLNEAGVISLTSADYDYLNRYYNTSDPQMIDCIWQLHPELYRTNVFQLHPPGNRIESLCGGKAEGIKGFPALVKGKYVRQEFIPQIERLADEILAIDPNLIVALGNSALWALAGKTGISKLRGTTLTTTHLVSGYKLFCTYHPAAVLRQWELRPVTVIDLMKVTREAEYPEIKKPEFVMWLEPTLLDLELFYEQYIQECKLLSVDIETSGNQITCIGFAPSKSLSLVVPFVDYRKKSRNYWPTLQEEVLAWKFVKKVCESDIAKVGQNILYDTAFTWRSYGIQIRNIQHDDMLLHHSLQPESLKGLGFLGSVYTDWPSWKSMRSHTTTIKADD